MFAKQVSRPLAVRMAFALVDSAAASFTPVPLAHAVGFAVGALTPFIALTLPIGVVRSVSYDRGG